MPWDLTNICSFRQMKIHTPMDHLWPGRSFPGHYYWSSALWAWEHNLFQWLNNWRWFWLFGQNKWLEWNNRWGSRKRRPSWRRIFIWCQWLRVSKQKIIPILDVNESNRTKFGASLAINAEDLFIGALDTNEFTGRVYYFQSDETTLSLRKSMI